ncbi:hypothetical protein OPV22_021069 [Ensete ventricosum]|uniref:Uncharacterized protein n=1 Tax=Ensete ventricosum TaxID=4639 RepID=A0AAV8QGB6_ENSVE|nr:hypothetical protein OPV22_021069 [Ensete ventricosum]
MPVAETREYIDGLSCSNQRGTISSSSKKKEASEAVDASASFSFNKFDLVLPSMDIYSSLVKLADLLLDPKALSEFEIDLM